LELGLLRLKKVTPKAGRRLQLRYDIYVIITTSEDEQLDAHGFPSDAAGVEWRCPVASLQSGREQAGSQ